MAEANIEIARRFVGVQKGSIALNVSGAGRPRVARETRRGLIDQDVPFVVGTAMGDRAIHGEKQRRLNGLSV